MQTEYNEYKVSAFNILFICIETTIETVLWYSPLGSRSCLSAVYFCGTLKDFGGKTAQTISTFRHYSEYLGQPLLSKVKVTHNYQVFYLYDGFDQYFCNLKGGFWNVNWIKYSF